MARHNQKMKTLKIKTHAKKHKYYTVSARLNYYEMIKFREIQKSMKLSSSELIRRLMREY